MEMAEKIKSLRHNLGLTLEEVGNAVGVGKSTVRKWESGQIANMRRDKIAKLAQALHTTPAYLMGWEEQKTDLPEGAFPYTPTHKIPILGYISAGLPLYAEQHIEGYTYTELNGGAEYFGLIVKGDSMDAAKIFPGAVLIIRRQEQVENGEIAVVIVDDENATVKRFRRENDVVILTPQSTNPEHQTQIYNLKTTNIKIIGKVVRVEYSLE